MTTLTEFIARVEERTEKAGSARSDDFGHDTHALMLWESQQLQTACDDIEKLVKLVRKLDKGLDDVCCCSLKEYITQDKICEACVVRKQCEEILNE